MSSAPTNTNKGTRPRTFNIGLLPCRFELPRIQLWHDFNRDTQISPGNLAISRPCLAYINTLFLWGLYSHSEAMNRTATGFRRSIHYFVEHQIVASKVTFAKKSGSPGV